MKQYNNLIIGAIIIIVLVVAGILILKGKKVTTNTDITFTTTEQNEIENSRQLASEYVDSLDYFGSPVKKFKIARVSEPAQLPESYNQGNEAVYGIDVSFEVTPEDITKVGTLAGTGQVQGDNITDLFASLRYTKTTDSENKTTYKIIETGTEPVQVSLEPQPAQ